MDHHHHPRLRQDEDNDDDARSDDSNVSLGSGAEALPDLPSPLSSVADDGNDDAGLSTVAPGTNDEEAQQVDTQDDSPPPQDPEWLFTGMQDRHLETVKDAWQNSIITTQQEHDDHKRRRVLTLQGVEIDRSSLEFLIHASTDQRQGLNALILDQCTFATRRRGGGEGDNNPDSDDDDDIDDHDDIDDDDLMITLLGDFLQRQEPTLHELSYIRSNMPPASDVNDTVLPTLLRALGRINTIVRNITIQGCNLMTMDNHHFSDDRSDANHTPQLLSHVISQLEALRFQNCRMDDNAWHAISHGIQGQREEQSTETTSPPLLQTLSLFSCNLSNPNLSQLFHPTLVSLTHLDLSFNPLTIQSLPTLTHILECNSSLQTFLLGWTNQFLHPRSLTEDHAAILQFLHAIQSHACLQELSLAGSGLTRSATLFQTIQQCRSLQALDFCEHADMNQSEWIDAIPHLTLRRLNLSRTVWQEWLHGEGWREWFRGDGFSNALWQNLELQDLGDEANLEIDNQWIQSILKRNRLLHQTKELFADQGTQLPVSLWPNVLYKVGIVEQQPDCVYFFVKATIGAA